MAQRWRWQPPWALLLLLLLLLSRPPRDAALAQATRLDAGHRLRAGCLLRPHPPNCLPAALRRLSKDQAHSLKGLWCSGIKSASHAEGPGFHPQQVQLPKSLQPSISNVA